MNTTVIKCYQYMPDLPLVPDHLVKKALLTANDGKQNPQKAHVNANPKVYKTKTFIENDGREVTGRNLPRFQLDEEWNQWVRDNISDKCKDSGVAVSMLHDSATQDSGSMKAHTDATRNFVLFYLIHRDTDDQLTQWYQEPGQPVHRPNGIWAEDMTKVIELDTIQIPLHTWIYLDGRILHRPLNIRGDRISLAISFDQDPFGVFT